MKTENIITKLKELDLSLFPKDEIESLLAQLELRIFCITYTFHNKVILRARPNQSINEEFRNFSDYSYVPFKKNLNYCRASVPKKSMLYASVVLEDGLDGRIQGRLKTTCAFETIPMLQDVNSSCNWYNLVFSSALS